MIKAFVYGFANVGKKAIFAVNIVDDVGNKHERIVPILTKSAYTAELAAISYVCHALADKDCIVNVYTSVPHIAKLFNRNSEGEWPKIRNKNSEFITEVRNLADSFKKFSCDVLEKESDEMQHMIDLTKKVKRS